MKQSNPLVKMRIQRTLKNILYHSAVILFAWVMIYPVLWMLMGSFKTSNEILHTAHKLIPKSFNLENYRTGHESAFNEWQDYPNENSIDRKPINLSCFIEIHWNSSNELYD